MSGRNRSELVQQRAEENLLVTVVTKCTSFLLQHVLAQSQHTSLSARFAAGMLIPVWTTPHWLLCCICSLKNKSASEKGTSAHSFESVQACGHLSLSALLVLCHPISSSVVGLLALRSPSHTLQRPQSLIYNSLAGWIKERVDPVTFHRVYNLLATAAADEWNF